ncbi:MAG: ABC transporter ATP-binding protein [Nitrosopumilus sp.]|nr:ABC transporter ATP-binding protein [Nitrosopumilus sp.]
MSSVSARGLEAGYGASRVIFGVDFEAPPRQITVIVGPNGGGKSTLLKAVFGLCTVHSGSITCGGREVAGMPPHRIAREGVAYLPQTDNVFSALTVRENLVMAGYALSKAERAERMPGALGAFPELQRYESGRASVLSGGQRQMLAMSMALLRRPAVMLFDEPTAGLSPKLAGLVLDNITSVRDRFGITVVLVEQNARRALGIADRAFLIAGGRRVFDGPPDGLLSNPDLGRMYLGLT